MTHEEWEHEYHLTPHGWITGSFYFRGTLAKQVPVPHDRLMTVTQENMYFSADAPVKTTWRCDWRSSDHTAEEINTILLQYGHRPPEWITSPISNLMAKSSHTRIKRPLDA